MAKFKQKSMRYDQNDYEALRASNIPASLVGTRFDSAEDASVFFARELDYVKSQSYDVEYPELTALSLFPMSSEVDPGAETPTVSKLTTLSAAHDDGSVVTRYGYGYYSKTEVSKNVTFRSEKIGYTGYVYYSQRPGGSYLKLSAMTGSEATNADADKALADLMPGYTFHSWESYREQARAAMTELCRYVDVCISNEEDAKDVFGIEAENTDIYGGEINHEGYKSVAKQLADRFGFEKVAITLRESHSAFDNGWSAMLYDVKSGEYCFSKKYELHIIDRVGGGDSFGGGLIYSLLTGKSTQAAVEFAVAASALKHSVEGDYNMVTVAEVEKLAGGDGSGRIQR